MAPGANGMSGRSGTRPARGPSRSRPLTRPAPRQTWKALTVIRPAPQPPAVSIALPVSLFEHWFNLPARPTSARAARDTARERLRTWQVPDDTCCDAVLLISELATNAFQHTDSGSFLCGLTLAGGQARLRIELHDSGTAALRPPQAPGGPCQEGGRGLFLVQELADRWGTAPSTRVEGKVIWAELISPR